MLKNLDKLLEFLLPEEIKEKAVNSTEATQSGLALFVIPSGNRIEFILLNVKTAINDFASNSQKINLSRVKYKKELFQHILGTCFINKITNSSQEKIYEVKATAAEHGYGPLLYDIAMSYVYPGWLTSDRENISPEALSVWSFYYNNRNSDVEKEALDTLEPPNVRDPNQGFNKIKSLSTDPLKYKYRIKQPESIQVLVKNGEDMLSSINDVLTNGKLIIRNISMLGNLFFQKKYYK